MNSHCLEFPSMLALYRSTFSALQSKTFPGERVESRESKKLKTSVL